MNTDFLKELGLTDNEITVYLSLIQNGQSTASTITEKTGLHRGYVYDILSTLINKGIVSSTIKSSKKYFRGINPKRFRDIIKEKERKINDIIPELLKIYKQDKPDYNVEIYEGKEGLKSYFDIMFDYYVNHAKKREVLIFGFNELFDEKHILYYFLHGKTKQATKLGLIEKFKSGEHKGRVLYEYSAKDEDRVMKKWMKCRYLPKKYKLTDKAIKIFGDKVSIESYKGRPFVILISNKGINEFFRNLFDMLWEFSVK